MKKFLIALTGFLFTCGFKSFAQDSKPAKGYYSITGKNSQRSAVTNPVQLNDLSGRYPAVTKGYYSINGHNKKLPRETRIYLPTVRPVATKGYYSMPAKPDSLHRKDQE